MSNNLSQQDAQKIFLLLSQNVPYRRIAAICGISRTTVKRYAKAKVIGYDLAGNLIYGWDENEMA